MAEFRVIDADSHVEEPEEAWGYLDPKYEARRPFPITGENRPFLHSMNSFWYIDGCVYPKVVGQGVTIYATPVTMARAKLKPFSLDSQTLLEPAARLKDMDVGGVDVQVIFPTIFLEPLSEDPRFEAALMKSYNSWNGVGLPQASRPAQMGGGFAHALGARSGGGDAPRKGSRCCQSSGLRNRRGDPFEPRGFRPGLV